VGATNNRLKHDHFPTSQPIEGPSANIMPLTSREERLKQEIVGTGWKRANFASFSKFAHVLLYASSSRSKHEDEESCKMCQVRSLAHTVTRLR
jgi:hypothetical protein